MTPQNQNTMIRRIAPLACVGITAVFAACVTTKTTSYVPSPQNPTYTPAEGERALRQYVNIQCAPRKAAQRPDTGSGAFSVDIDSSGHATRAEVRRSTNDESLDGIFGTVAAQLTFAGDSALAPLVKGRRAGVDITFHCFADSASVALKVGGRA